MTARRQQRSAWIGTVLTVALGAIYLGCAGANKTGKPIMSNAYQTEIVAMMSEIRGWRGELGLNLEPTGRVFGAMPKARDMCPDVEIVPECGDICTLAEHICENADNICRIADGDLKGDEWAKDKCSSAKASCKEARNECCGCQSDADAGPPNLPRQPDPAPAP